MLSVLQTLDGGALLWIQENLRGLLDPIVEGYTTLGNTGLMWIVLSLAMLCWKPTRKAGVAALAAMVLGLVLCYAFGTFWFLTVYTGGSGETLLGALTLCVFPYVLPDLGKIFLALVLVSRVKKHLAL